jgi:dTDP-glucose pyrophosphorylase
MHEDQSSKKAIRTPKVAILLAAGMGIRQRPLTHHTPKPLLYARNRPLIDYTINALVYSGIKTIYVVTHYLECQIVGYLEKYRKNNLDIIFCHQEAVNGTAGAVSAAKKHLKRIERTTDYLVISATDYVYPKGYIKELMDFHSERSNDISISLRNIDPEMAEQSSSVVIDTDGHLVCIKEKPTNHGDDRIVAATLLYIVPVKIFDFLTSVNVSVRGEYELPDAINNMIKDGYRALGLKQSSMIEPEYTPISR